MAANIGSFALFLALCIALSQASIPLIGVSCHKTCWMKWAQNAAFIQCLLVTVAFFSLMYSYITSDFSLVNVASNSHTDKPLFYKITGVWGNHEGSMLLWELILTIYGASVALFSTKLPLTLRARALAVQSIISVAFLLFIIFTSNPFIRMDFAPLNGNGLNPLLQDPGLAFHPPILYLGYVGFSMAFSFAIAALLEGKADAEWARFVRPWTLAAWCFLTLGITGGSWWAYYTLGWGGWWYWDPTENASFMPWLTGTALLHSMIVLEKRNTMKAWTILLAIITFSLSLLGTFLVRSGVLTSVHSFASDPARGVFILALLGIISGGSLILFAVRAPTLKGEGVFSPISREGSLLFNNMMLVVAAATVFTGTLYPLFSDVFDMGKVSVGPPFFNITFIPLMIPLILIMAIGPTLAWKQGNIKTTLTHLLPALTIIMLITLLTYFTAITLYQLLWSIIGFSLAAWLISGIFLDWANRVNLFKLPLKMSIARAIYLPLSTYGMFIAHIGIALLIIGITGSSLWRTEKIQVMHVGETTNIAGYTLTFKNVEENIKEANYTTLRASFSVSADKKSITELKPEKRLFTMPPLPTTHAAIHTTLLGDLYVVVADKENTGGYITRIYYDPLVIWIFIGGALMAGGGLTSLSQRKFSRI
jgi:cytochrome c-type biogenesis protein CcmF